MFVFVLLDKEHFYFYYFETQVLNKQKELYVECCGAIKKNNANSEKAVGGSVTVTKFESI